MVLMDLFVAALPQMFKAKSVEAHLDRAMESTPTSVILPLQKLTSKIRSDGNMETIL